MGSAIGGILPQAIGVAISPIPIIAEVLMLNGWKAWLTANNGTVMAVLLLVLGVKLLGDALGGLLG
jgi:hypothetical protein